MHRATRRKRSKARSKGWTFTILDRGRLAAVLDRAIRTRFGGNVSAAARSVGMPQSQVYRFSRGALGGARRETLERLAKLVLPSERREIRAALLPRETVVALRRYDRWLRESAAPAVLGLDVLSSLVKRPWEAETASATLAFRSHELQRLVRVLRRRFPQPFDRFAGEMQRRGHARQRRIALAVARVVAPLLDAGASGGIERDVDELSESELRRFLAAGFARERILLRRAPDVLRAQEALKRTRPRIARHLLQALGYGRSE